MWKSLLSRLPPHLRRVTVPICLCCSVAFAFFLLATFLPSDRLGFPGWYSLCAVVILLIVLVTDVFEDTGIAFVFGLGLLVLGGKDVVSLESAVDGYGDVIVFAVCLLSIVSKGVRESTLLDYFVVHVLGNDPNMSATMALCRLLPPVMISSAFMSNTAIVTMMVPVVTRWSDTIGVPARVLLLPMNFATLMGGMCTLIGTSVNLALSSMVRKKGKVFFSPFLV